MTGAGKFNAVRPVYLWFVRCEVLTVVKMTIFWVMTPKVDNSVSGKRTVSIFRAEANLY
jgi:hypothetical protein